MFIVLQVVQMRDHTNTNKIFYYFQVDIFDELHIVQLSEKHEKLFQDICWIDAYLTLDLGDKYADILKNNITHIYSAEMNIGIVDMHTLLPWPCQMLFHRYGDHVSLQSFICLKNTMVHFTRPYVLRFAALVFQFFQLTIPPRQ